MKPGRLFKLSKTTKRYMATMPKQRSSIYKKYMIEAELAALVVPKRERRTGNDDA